MTDDEHRVDPRYDPAFQRGYTGQTPPRVLRGLGQRTTTASQPPTESVRRDAAEGQADHAPTSEFDAVPETAPVSADAHAHDPGERSPTMCDLGRNPFLIALVILGVALTVGGIVWGNHARETIASVANEFDYWYLQASVVGAPLTSITGIAVLAGVLFVAAAAWNRR